MKKIFVFSILSAILTSSCISIQFTNLDIQTPPTVLYPYEVVNIAIANNTLFDSRGTEQSEYSFSLPTDSLSWVFVDTLTKYLDQQRFFGQVISIPYNTRSDYKFNRVNALTPQQVQSICKDAKVEGLVSLDFMQIGGKLARINNQTDFDEAELAMNFHILLNAYKSDGSSISKPIIYNDTIYWYGYPANYANIIPEAFLLPALEEAYSSTINYAVDNALKIFTPTWSTEERVYFSNGSKYMKEANKLIAKNDWQGAVSAWEKAYEQETNDSKRARIAYNLALGNEVLDNINKAFIWIKAAKSLENNISQQDIRNQINWYYDVLEKRNEQIKRIEEQLETNSSQKKDQTH